MNGLPLDLSGLPDEVQHEFLECRHTREVAALAGAERQVAGGGFRGGGRHDERRSVEGLGAAVAEIHPISFHYWGRRLGYECWHDREFVKEYLRDVPEARVKSVGTKTQVGFGPAAGGLRTELKGLSGEGGSPARAAQTGRLIPQPERRAGDSVALPYGRFQKSYGQRVGEAALQR